MTASPWSTGRRPPEDEYLGRAGHLGAGFLAECGVRVGETVAPGGPGPDTDRGSEHRRAPDRCRQPKAMSLCSPVARWSAGAACPIPRFTMTATPVRDVQDAIQRPVDDHHSFDTLVAVFPTTRDRVMSRVARMLQVGPMGGADERRRDDVQNGPERCASGLPGSRSRLHPSLGAPAAVTQGPVHADRSA